MARWLTSRTSLALVAATLLPGCVIAERSRRGALLPEDAIAGLRDGVTTRAEVVRALGPPVVVARREGTVRLRLRDEPRLGDVELPGLDCFGPLAALPPLPGDVVYLYRAARVWEHANFDFTEDCKLCLPTVHRSSGLATTHDALYLLFDEETGRLRAHAHLRDGLPRERQAAPATSPSPAPSGWGQP